MRGQAHGKHSVNWRITSVSQMVISLLPSKLEREGVGGRAGRQIPEKEPHLRHALCSSPKEGVLSQGTGPGHWGQRASWARGGTEDLPAR